MEEQQQNRETLRWEIKIPYDEELIRWVKKLESSSDFSKLPTDKRTGLWQLRRSSAGIANY